MHRLDEEEESLEACSKDDQDPLTGLSQSIREYCTPKELETLDMVTNLAQMARLYREYESEGGAKHDDNTTCLGSLRPPSISRKFSPQRFMNESSGMLSRTRS